MNCAICGERTVLLQKGTLRTTKYEDTAILHGGKVYCQPCIEVLVAKYAKASVIGNLEPPPTPGPTPPLGAALENPERKIA